ncbi:hypothetical protein, partial [Escherichia coli]|uniref:hypothetical protein n=1 Tax=Escherichia coli TaxID=562 RepID=UPI000CBFD178
MRIPGISGTVLASMPAFLKSMMAFPAPAISLNDSPMITSQRGLDKLSAAEVLPVDNESALTFRIRGIV